MIHCGPNRMHVNFVDPSLDCAATAAGVTCDCKGYNYLLCCMAGDTQANTSIFPIAFELQQCENTIATNFATIAGYVAGTDYTIPTASRDAGICNSYMLGISLVGKMRYFRVVARSTTTTEVAASWFNLFRPDESPGTSAEANCELAYFG